jgi:hypothetical protein
MTMSAILRYVLGAARRYVPKYTLVTIDDAIPAPPNPADSRDVSPARAIVMLWPPAVGTTMSVSRLVYAPDAA